MLFQVVPRAVGLIIFILHFRRCLIPAFTVDMARGEIVKFRCFAFQQAKKEGSNG